MFRYLMKLVDKKTDEVKIIAHLTLHRSIHDLGVEKEQIRIYANKVNLNKYAIVFTER